MWASQLQNFCTRSSDAWAERRDLPNDTGTHQKTAHEKTANAFITSRSSSWCQGYKCSTFCFGSSSFELFGKCIWAVCRYSTYCSTCSSSCFYLPDFVNIRKTSPNKAADVFTLRFYETYLAIIPGIFSSRSSVHLGQVIEMETAGWINSFMPTLRLWWWWDMLIRWVKFKQLTKAS